MEVIQNSSEQHWGSYDAVDHGYDARQNSPFARGVSAEALSQYYDGPLHPYEDPRTAAGHGFGVQLPPSPFGQLPQIPGLPSLPGGAPAATPYEMYGLIKRVPPSAAAAVLSALALLSGPAARPGVQGSATFTASPSTSLSSWPQDFVSAGYTVLMDVMSPPSAQGGRSLAVVAPGPNAPAEVRDLAGAAGSYAVVQGPSTVIEAARQCPPGMGPQNGGCVQLPGVNDCPEGYVYGPEGQCVRPTGPCPPGTVVGADGGCLPDPNAPQPPPVPTQKPPIPWMAVAGVAGGLALIALAAHTFMGGKR